MPGEESVTINSRKGMIEVEGEFADGAVEAKLEALGLELVVVSPVVDLDLDA